MKIIFIDPPFKVFTGFNNPLFPLGLSYLSAVCKKAGHHATVFEVDAINKNNTTDMDFSHEHQKLELYKKAVNDANNPIWKEIVSTASAYNPDIIGISVMTTKFASAIRTADLLKQEFPDIPVLFGGPHATLLPNQCLLVNSVDYVMRGESENIILQFLEFLKGERDIQYVESLSHRSSNGDIIHNKLAKPIENLDEIPFPDRESLLYHKNYSSEDMGLLIATRGCPFNCSYCSHIFGRKLRKRSIENVLSEIQLVTERYGTKQFSFKDDTFTVDKKWITKFCETSIKEGIKINWDCTTRVDTITPELIALMKKAGCNDIRIGIETGSQDILKKINKGISFDQITNAVKILNENNMLWTAYFMYGLPYETVDDIKKTINFMREIDPNYASLGLYSPFPETELFDEGVMLNLLDKSVGIDHFFSTNPKDYYFKDPEKRVQLLSPSEFKQIEDEIQSAFSKQNKKISHLLKRVLSRKDSYFSDPLLFVKDLKRGIKLFQ